MLPLKKIRAILVIYAVFYTSKAVRRQVMHRGFFLPLVFSNRKDYRDYRRLNDRLSKSELHELLFQKIPFYRLLDANDSCIFRTRLVLLLKTKWFLGRQGIKLNNEMMLTIGALMVQVTFGFNNFLFPHFQRIAIFPDIFYSKLFERYVRGLTVYHTGVILLSWPHVEHGIDDEHDKINLGIHELAHAIYLDYFEHKNMLKGFDRWTSKALKVFKKMQLNSKDFFLREYAATNIHEFWAVCVEHFFEAPVEFREQLPELYAEMCKILNQDMAARFDSISQDNSYTKRMA